MTASGPPDVEVVQAVAAAVVSSSGLPANVAAQIPDASQKFVVHPHLASVDKNDKLLSGYLRNIYTDRPALQTAYPGLTAFKYLTATRTLQKATKTIAEALAVHSDDSGHPFRLKSDTVPDESGQVQEQVVPMVAVRL